MHKSNFRLVPKQFRVFTHSYHTRQRSTIEYAIPWTRLKIAKSHLHA